MMNATTNRIEVLGNDRLKIPRTCSALPKNCERQLGIFCKTR